MTGPRDRQFTAKAEWHRTQRLASPREKVRIVIDLQHRELAADRVRAALGRPVVRMTPWRTTP